MLFKSPEAGKITRRDRFLIVRVGQLKDKNTPFIMSFLLKDYYGFKRYAAFNSWKLTKLSGLPDNFSPLYGVSNINAEAENKEHVQKPKKLSLKEIQKKLGNKEFKNGPRNL